MTKPKGHWIKTVRHHDNHSTTYLLELLDGRAATERLLFQNGSEQWDAWWDVSYMMKAPGLIFGVPAGDCTYVSFALLRDGRPSFGTEICVADTDIEVVKSELESALTWNTAHETQVAFARLAY